MKKSQYQERLKKPDKKKMKLSNRLAGRRFRKLKFNHQKSIEHKPQVGLNLLRLVEDPMLQLHQWTHQITVPLIQPL